MNVDEFEQALGAVEAALAATDAALQARASEDIGAAIAAQTAALTRAESLGQQLQSAPADPPFSLDPFKSRLRACKHRIDAQSQVIATLSAVNNELLRHLCGVEHTGYGADGSVDRHGAQVIARA